MSRRTLTGAAAAVAIGAIAVGGWQLASDQTPSHHDQHSTGSATVPVRSSRSQGSSQFAGGSTVESISSSSTLVTYPAPSGSYTLTFTSTTPCWLGVETSTSNSSWLVMKTLSSGTWNYQATGPVVVRIGAPRNLTVTLNGETVQLSGSVNPYDISFIASNETSV